MKRFFRYLFILLSFLFFLSGTIFESFNLMLSGALLFLASNVLYCFEDVHRRIYFLFFNITFFTFFLGRPLINMLKFKSWWYFGDQPTIFALNSIMISLICMFIGHYLCDKISRSEMGYYFFTVKNSKFIYNLRIISRILFYVSFLFYFLGEVEKFLFMRSRDYAELYSSYKSGLPGIFNFLGAICKYFLCIYLSTLPSKFESSVCLSLFVFSSIPSFLIGSRTGLVLNIIFSFIYYFTRDSINNKILRLQNKKKWIGNFEKLFLILGSPILLFILGVWNYLRDKKSSNLGVLATFVDFFEKQGVSFDVLCFGYKLFPTFTSQGINYTFGRIIDYFAHGKLSQILFGTNQLSEFHQSIEHVLYSNNFAHKLSYAVSPQEFLSGHGYGSSFILETYADFGYLGIALYSLILGMFFSSIIKIMNKGSIYMSVVLISLMNLFYLGRDASSRWIEFIIYFQFIVPVAACYMLAKLCIKEYSNRKNL